MTSIINYAVKIHSTLILLFYLVLDKLFRCIYKINLIVISSRNITASTIGRDYYPNSVPIKRKLTPVKSKKSSISRYSDKHISYASDISSNH